VWEESLLTDTILPITFSSHAFTRQNLKKEENYSACLSSYHQQWFSSDSDPHPTGSGIRIFILNADSDPKGVTQARITKAKKQVTS
jgi:hypothetical protein